MGLGPTSGGVRKSNTRLCVVSVDIVMHPCYLYDNVNDTIVA